MTENIEVQPGTIIALAPESSTTYTIMVFQATGCLNGGGDADDLFGFKVDGSSGNHDLRVNSLVTGETNALMVLKKSGGTSWWLVTMGGDRLTQTTVVDIIISDSSKSVLTDL